MPPNDRADRNGEREHAPPTQGDGVPSPDEAALPHHLAVPVVLSGLVVDAFPKRWILVVANGLRASGCFVFLMTS